MLKYAFMSFSTPALSLEDTLALAKRLGYDGIEPRIEAGHRHGIEMDASPAQRAEARQKAVDSGIALCCIATSRMYANPDTRPQEIEMTRRCIDLAADVGAPCIRVFGGVLPEGLSREAAIEGVAECLRAVADRAGERGVAVCVETHDDWSDPRPLAEVMKRVNHPAVAVNWDFLHPVWRVAMPPEESFRILRPWIRHSHIHDATFGENEPLKLVWIGEGKVDHRKAVERLRSIGYTGCLSGEWIDRQPGYQEHLPRELAILKGYEG